MSAKRRLLLAKTGLDCHDTGIVTVAQELRDAGYEVIYLGLHNHPDEVVKAAIEEGVDGIGVSYLSGQHMPQMRQLLEAMRKASVSLPIFCGGVIPARGRHRPEIDGRCSRDPTRYHDGRDPQHGGSGACVARGALTLARHDPG